MIDLRREVVDKIRKRIRSKTPTMKPDFVGARAAHLVDDYKVFNPPHKQLCGPCRRAGIENCYDRDCDLQDR